MLTLNPSNIGDVSEALNSLCLREFQTIGEAIATLTLSTITSLPNSPDDLTPYSAQNDPHGFAAKAYQDDVKQNKANLETRKRELLKLYGYLISILSRESRELVISDAKYAAIQTATNGFQLWELIYALHTTALHWNPLTPEKTVPQLSLRNCVKMRQLTQPRITKTSNLPQRSSTIFKLMRQQRSTILLRLFDFSRVSMTPCTGKSSGFCKLSWTLAAQVFQRPPKLSSSESTFLVHHKRRIGINGHVCPSRSKTSSTTKGREVLLFPQIQRTLRRGVQCPEETCCESLRELFRPTSFFWSSTSSPLIVTHSAQRSAGETVHRRGCTRCRRRSNRDVQWLNGVQGRTR
jgi:hypothetical protein